MGKARNARIGNPCIVLLGIVFLVYFFVNLCRDSRRGHAIVCVEVLNGPAMGRGFCRQDTHQPKLLRDLPADRDGGEVDQGECQASSTRWAPSTRQRFLFLRHKLAV